MNRAFWGAGVGAIVLTSEIVGLSALLLCGWVDKLIRGKIGAVLQGAIIFACFGLFLGGTFFNLPPVLVFQIPGLLILLMGINVCRRALPEEIELSPRRWVIGNSILAVASIVAVRWFTLVSTALSQPLP